MMWVEEKMGRKFIEVPLFELSKCFDDSTVTTPLIFVLSAGSDPLADFRKLAEEKGMLRKCEIISLG